MDDRVYKIVFEQHSFSISIAFATSLKAKFQQKLNIYEPKYSQIQSNYY